MLKIADLRHTVHLCTQRDLVEDGTLCLERHDVKKVRAAIREKQKYDKTAGGFINDGEVQTHEIVFRYDPDLVLTNYVWVYEGRRKSQPRWFKVIRQGMTEGAGARYRCLYCKLYEEADDAEPPSSLQVVRELPEGVRLD